METVRAKTSMKLSHPSRLIATSLVLVTIILFNTLPTSPRNDVFYASKSPMPIGNLEDTSGWPFAYVESTYDFSVTEIDTIVSYTRSANILPLGIFLNVVVAGILTSLTYLALGTLIRLNGSVFRVHLRTLVILMLILSALLGLNLAQISPWDAHTIHCGWPYIFVTVQEPYSHGSQFVIGHSTTNWISLAKNVCVAMYLLFLAGTVTEISLSVTRQKRHM